MTKIIRYKTNILFPRTSTIVGMGSLLNIGGNYFEFNYSKSGEDADAKAFESDWAMIGQDIEDAINKTSDKLVCA
jgi:hypothetical protein